MSDSEPKWEPGEQPREYLKACIDAKWQAGLECLENSWSRKAPGLLVADTIVVLGTDVLGKPESVDEAHDMLARLSGRTHLVWTGVRLGRVAPDGSRKTVDRVVESKVTFHGLSPDEIKDYVARDKPFDKAGSYGFQDRALLFVERVVGPYTNIIGLPVEAVREMARELRFV